MIKGVFLSVNPKTVLDPKTDFAFLSANLNPDFWSRESFLKKDPLDLKSEESKSINGLVTYAVPFTVDSKLVRRYLPVALFPIEVFLYSFLVAAICCKKSENAGRLFLIQ